MSCEALSLKCSTSIVVSLLLVFDVRIPAFCIYCVCRYCLFRSWMLSGELFTRLAVRSLYVGVIDILNSLLLLSQLLALAINYLLMSCSNSIPIGSLLDSATESDSKSNELKMLNTNTKIMYINK